MKRRICPNTPLNALTAFSAQAHGAQGWPSSQPSATPPAMAMRIFEKRPIFIFRMAIFYQTPARKANGNRHCGRSADFFFSRAARTRSSVRFTSGASGSAARARSA